MSYILTLLGRDLQRYGDYFFETKGFTSDIDTIPVSERAIQTAQSIRGADRGPAVIVQGVMPRSGSVYVGELLRRHPDLYAYPQQLWEFPALQLARDVRRLQEKFLRIYKRNKGKIEDGDFLPLFGACLLAYLYHSVPSERRVLVKMPSVQYLSHFFSMFPHENLLILVRDGRDLVHSTLRTWPQLNFLQVCLRWNRSARIILSTLDSFKATKRSGYCVVKYEDALEDPVSFVRGACRQFGLDENRYPYEQIDAIRVIGSSKLGQTNKVKWRYFDKPRNFKPVGYWQKWSRAKKLIFKLVAGRSLVRLGYCEDLKW